MHCRVGRNPTERHKSNPRCRAVLFEQASIFFGRAKTLPFDGPVGCQECIKRPKQLQPEGGWRDLFATAPGCTVLQGAASLPPGGHHLPNRRFLRFTPEPQRCNLRCECSQPRCYRARRAGSRVSPQTAARIGHGAFCICWAGAILCHRSKAAA